MSVYAIGGALLATLLLVGGAYLKGRNDGVAIVHGEQLVEYQKAFADEAKAAGERMKADSDARLAAERFMSNVRKNLAQVREDFDGIPQVTINGDGCPDLSDAFRLRWNAAERAAGGAGPGSGERPPGL